jgi:Zn-finger nucleic acid-binding protein
MLCPTCHTTLTINRDPHGAIWLCDRCSGAAANLAVLRKRLKADLATDFWRKVLAEGRPSARPCPECQRAMTGFKISVGGQQIGLDLCKRCQVVWFDGGELEALPKPVAPRDDLSPEVKQKLAILQIQQENALEAQLDDDAARASNWANITEVVLRLLLRIVLKI